MTTFSFDATVSTHYLLKADALYALGVTAEEIEEAARNA